MLTWFVIVPVLIAVFIYVLPFKKAGRVIAIAVQIILVCGTFYIFLITKEGDIVTNIGNYSNLLGILLKADTLSSVFVMLTAFTFWSRPSTVLTMTSAGFSGSFCFFGKDC